MRDNDGRTPQPIWFSLVLVRVRKAGTAALGFFSRAALAGENPVRYLRFEEVQETLRLNADSGLPGSEIKGSRPAHRW